MEGVLVMGIFLLLILLLQPKFIIKYNPEAFTDCHKARNEWYAKPADTSLVFSSYPGHPFWYFYKNEIHGIETNDTCNFDNYPIGFRAIKQFYN